MNWNGQTEGVEREVVRAAGVLDRHVGGPEVMEGASHVSKIGRTAAFP
jgi:hypothetical protein